MSSGFVSGGVSSPEDDPKNDPDTDSWSKAEEAIKLARWQQEEQGSQDRNGEEKSLYEILQANKGKPDHGNTRYLESKSGPPRDEVQELTMGRRYDGLSSMMEL